MSILKSCLTNIRKKNTSYVFFFLFFFLELQSSELIKLHVSKNHNFITFIESLSGAKYVSVVPKKIYLSKYKNDIDRFASLHQEISKSTIKKHPRTRSLLKALYVESLATESLAAFEKKIRSYDVGIERKKLHRYFAYLRKLYPRFEKILWKKTHRGLEYRKEKLEKLIDAKDFDTTIRKVMHFYGVTQKDIGVMDIAFYPISYGNNINAYSIGNIESIGIFVGRSQNLIWMLTATILHELGHSIYAKSSVVKENFLNIEDKKRKRTINEVLATAVGAGWGYNSLTGKYAVKAWYNNRTYDKFGKIVYPKLKEYITNERTIDAEFVAYIKGLL